MSGPAYRRVLLKLSGEMLAGSQGFGIDPDVLTLWSAEIKKIHKLGVELGIVIGGGNFIRGVAAAAGGMDRTTADQMGMLATVMNAMALSESFNKAGVPARVMSAQLIQGVVEPFVQKRAIKLLANKEVIIFAGGTGNPYFSTDTAVALRAAQVKADVIFKATKVDGVYDADPAKNPKAKLYRKLTHQQCLQDGLQIMDAAAFSLCRDNKLPILVFNMTKKGNVLRAVKGETIGTYVGEA